MSDTYCKRRAGEQLASPGKRAKVSIDSEGATSAMSDGIERNERLQPCADFESFMANAEPTSIQYCGKISLQPEELLMYALVNLSVPPGTNLARCSLEKLAGVSFGVYKVYGIYFNCKHIQNFFYRSTNNLCKGLGKFNGYLRWKYFSNYIERIVSKHQQALHSLFVDSDDNSQCFDDLKNDLESQCLSSLSENESSQSLAYKISKTNSSLERKFPKWKVVPDVNKSEVHLFFMANNSPVVFLHEVVIIADGSYYIVYKEKRKSLDVNLDLPQTIHRKDQLYLFMTSLEKLNICSAILAEKYINLLPEENTTPVFKTNCGDPGAFVETTPTCGNKKYIRSAKCSLLSKDTCCKECMRVDHYMRTLKSRSQNSVKHQSKHTRFDYMSKERLVENSKEMARKIHQMQVKLQRLEQYQQEMNTVGYNTDSDFRKLFKQLYEGISQRIDKQESNVCYWEDCLQVEDKFATTELLQKHISTVHIPTISDEAPINRKYQCKWLGCDKTFSKKKLLKSHLTEHTGNESDTFFLTLLHDQAKALNMPSRQMRWHPLVLKWCLRMYSKSHSVYDDLRASGFLKLPSGRTLSDYKNFCSSKSGWQASVMEAMRESAKKQGISESGKFGGLFFDEVKIKEGLLFDPSSWELIGFTDLDVDESDTSNDNMTTLPVQASLATHVLQFYFKSLFSSFHFPCSYFLTNGISAQDLNRVFWQGVELLNSHGFKVLLTCCDGASENRAFMVMNGCSETVSQTNNPFSNFPLFFLSDPPHLIKKLRNNIYKSGFKENSSRYTRCLLLNSKNILWEHIYSVYLRDKKRHLFSTDIRSSHVHLDSFSKMRVKLAVQVLNSKVQKDMAKYENDSTESTQKFILNCETLFNCFNDTEPLLSLEDRRIKALENVLRFFQNWRDQLTSIFKTKSEQSYHFISWQTMFDLQV